MRSVWSYERRCAASESTSFAVLMRWKRSAASGALFLSGWYWSASLRYARFTSAALAATDLYQVLDTSDLPGGVVNILPGQRDALVKTMVEHQDVDAIWYFGDARGSFEVSLFDDAVFPILCLKERRFEQAAKLF